MNQTDVIVYQSMAAGECHYVLVRQAHPVEDTRRCEAPNHQYQEQEKLNIFTNLYKRLPLVYDTSA